MTTKKSAFDLNALDTVAACNKPFEVEIKSIGGDPTGFFISVLGKDSDVFRAKMNSLANDGLRRRALGKQAASDVTVEKAEADSIDVLVAATTGWRFGDGNAVPLDGEQLEFTPDNARRVYARLLPIRDQVTEAIHDLGNFMPA